MIVTEVGAPYPPSDVLARLKEIDENLGLKFSNFPEPHWCVTWRWPQGDKRWERVQKGEITEKDAFDMFARLPYDCNADEAIGYVQRTFVRNSGNETIQWLLNRIDKLNAENQKRILQSTTDLAEELVETNAKTLYRDYDKRIPKVYT